MTYTYYRSKIRAMLSKDKTDKPLYKTRHGGLIKGIIGRKKNNSILVTTMETDIRDDHNFSPFK